MAYLDGYFRFADEDERQAIGITVARLTELLSQLPPEQLLIVSPVTRNLVLLHDPQERWIDLANETIEP